MALNDSIRRSQAKGMLAQVSGPVPQRRLKGRQKGV